MLFPTTLVGSYPQPEWLIDRKKLAGRFPPRVRARELWRIPQAFLAEAQDEPRLAVLSRFGLVSGIDLVGGCLEQKPDQRVGQHSSVRCRIFSYPARASLTARNCSCGT